MTITRNFKLCLNAGTQNAPYINVNQYDEGEQWIFDLYTEGGQKFTPSTGAIIGIKSDGNAILNSGTVNSDGQVVITETQQMTAASGLAVFELLIEGETHGTANFIVNVERRPSDDAEFSDSDLSVLQEAIDSAEEIEDLLGGQDVPTVITPIISDWLDENITNPSNPPIDTSLTVAGAAADAKATGDEITNLKSVLTENLTVLQPGNLLDLTALEDGYMQKNGSTGGSGASYKHTAKISVSYGDVISFWRFNTSGKNAVAIDARFLCAFDSSGNPISSAGSDATVSGSYTVTNSNVASIVLSIAVSYFSYDVVIKKGALAPQYYEPYFDPYYIATNKFLPVPYQIKSGSVKVTAASIDDSHQLEIPTTNIAKNVLIVYEGDISNFISISIGQGKTAESYHSYIKIDSTSLTFYINGISHAYEHGLQISDYIKVEISVDDNTKATVTITSNGTFSKKLGWYGFSRGIYYVLPNSTTVCTNNELTVIFRDIYANTFVFADSYGAIVESTAKWTHWLVAEGYGDKILLNGCPGINGSDSIISLQDVLRTGKSKYLFWCIGMNDGADADDTTPNSTWLANVNTVLSICENCGMIPVLATIPTVPTINNEGKNAWVRASDYRYVDFAKAVGAQSNGTWYTDMLSNDGVHPSELGARALWHQVLLDFPEIIL